jgi:hypothetical protein
VKKLAIIFLSVAFTGGVALACPHEEAEKAKEAAPKTAEKAKEADKAKTAKPAKPAEKKPADKVSQK